VRLITTGVLLALMAGIAIKLKLFGPSPQAINGRPTPTPDEDVGQTGMEVAP
jgi:hypothetical protein